MSTPPLPLPSTFESVLLFHLSRPSLSVIYPHCLYNHCTCSHLLSCRLLQVAPHGSPQVAPYSLQSVLNAAARLIARFPWFTHFSPIIFAEVLHWIPITSHIEYQILLVSESQLGLAPKYLSDFIMSKPLFNVYPTLVLYRLFGYLSLASGLP